MLYEICSNLRFAHVSINRYISSLKIWWITTYPKNVALIRLMVLLFYGWRTDAKDVKLWPTWHLARQTSCDGWCNQNQPVHSWPMRKWPDNWRCWQWDPHLHTSATTAVLPLPVTKHVICLNQTCISLNPKRHLPTSISYTILQY